MINKFKVLILVILSITALSSCTILIKGEHLHYYSSGLIKVKILEDNCEVFLDGGIEWDLKQVLLNALNHLKSENCKNKTLYLSSQGGKLSNAIEVGEIIRSQKFDIIVTGSGCYSACSLIFISGIERSIRTPKIPLFGYPDFGFHSPKTFETEKCIDIQKYRSDPSIKKVVSVIYNYSEKMLGKDSALLFTTNIFETNCEKMKIITPEILLKQGIVTKI